MLNDKLLASLNKILSKIETQDDVKALYNALQPLKFQLPYHTEWTEKKIEYIWTRANQYSMDNVEPMAKNKTWNAAKGNFITFQHLAQDYFATNGTKEQRILQLIKLIDFKWFQGKEATKEIAKAKSKSWTIKTSDTERDTCYVVDLTKPFKLRGMTNSSKIEQLIILLGLPKIDIPYYGDWSVRREAGKDWEDITIYLNGNIEIKNPLFHEALKPYVEKWFDTVWHTVCYIKAKK